MKEERAALTLAYEAICLIVVEVNGSNNLVRKVTEPELLRALLSTKTVATVIVAGCPNPEKAFSVGTIPKIIAQIKAHKATISYLNFPHINKQSVRDKIPRIMIWSNIN